MIGLAFTDRSPTRAIEFMLAWLMVAWGAALIQAPSIMDASQYRFLLAIMPSDSWAFLALGIGGTRLSALTVNGAWRRTPILRFLATLIGLNWWMLIFVLYLIAIRGGSNIFPAMFFYPIFMFFEIYSCFRCGQDARSMNALGAG